MTLGEKIKQARNNKRYTQKDLAKLVGVKHNTISNWEKDQNKPTPDIIELLCGALDVPPNYFFNSNAELTLSLVEQNIISKFRKLGIHGREIVSTVIEIEYKNQIEIESQQQEKEKIIKLKQQIKEDPYAVIAAHNDNENTDQLEKMQRDAMALLDD